MLDRAQTLWEIDPDLTIIRTAYVTGIDVTLIREWSRKEYLVRPEPKVVVPPPPPPPTEPQEKGPRTPHDDEWDEGSVPTIDSIRREIKRHMRARIMDSLMVSQYATALGRLADVKEDEGKEDLAGRELMTLFVPAEDRKPDA